MITFQNRAELKEWLIKSFDANDHRLISMDGLMDSGKTRLAQFLAKDIKIPHIKLDDDRYRIKDMAKFVESIRYENLIGDLPKYLKTYKKVIIDGVCILEVLSRIDCTSDLRIYVKKLIKDYWWDGNVLDYSKDIEAVIKGDMKERSIPNELVYHEVIRYHFKYQPELSAGIIFERPDL